MSFQTNKYFKALEDSIADCNCKINEMKNSSIGLHPGRELKSLRDRVQSLEDLLSFTKFLRKFQKEGF